MNGKFDLVVIGTGEAAAFVSMMSPNRMAGV